MFWCETACKCDCCLKENATGYLSVYLENKTVVSKSRSLKKKKKEDKERIHLHIPLLLSELT